MTGKISTGGDVDSFCTRCRLNLAHIVVAMVAGVPVRVKCRTCGSTHRFRGAPSDRPRPVRRESASPRSLRPTPASVVDAAEGPEHSYRMEDSYRPGDVIVHSVFGKGVVQKTLFRKCSILFRDRERILATANT